MLKKNIHILIPVLLIAFLISAMSLLVNLNFKGIKNTWRTEKSCPPDLEDCADASDAADNKTEDDKTERDYDFKEICHQSQLELQKDLVILKEHQMNMVGDHHPTIITPPPDSNERLFQLSVKRSAV